MEKIVNLIIKYINTSSLPAKWIFWQCGIFWQHGYSGGLAQQAPSNRIWGFYVHIMGTTALPGISATLVFRDTSAYHKHSVLTFTKTLSQTTKQGIHRGKWLVWALQGSTESRRESGNPVLCLSDFFKHYSRIRQAPARAICGTHKLL